MIEMYAASRVRAVVSRKTSNPRTTRSTRAVDPRICICRMIGISPMNGMLKSASDQPDSFAAGFLITVALAALALVPVRDAGPVVVAWRLVIVDDAAAVPGRAAGLAFGAPRRLNHSEIEDFGFIVCALAIPCLLRAYFQEPLLANERRQIEFMPACSAGIRVYASHPCRCIRRPRRGGELLGAAQP